MPTARRVDAATVRPLRTQVLRPGWAPASAVMDADDDATTAHFASERDGAVVAVGTIYPEAPPAEHRGAIPGAAYADGASFRLRGMASAPDARGAGHGAAVLRACFAHVRDAGSTFLWCNARVGALAFYERMGLEAVGEEFDMPEIGGHYVMWRRLDGP